MKKENALLKKKSHQIHILIRKIIFIDSVMIDVLYAINQVIKIIIIVALVVLVIGLAVGMFFLGKKMRNERRKRANELTDDNYDYSAGIINS